MNNLTVMVNRRILEDVKFSAPSIEGIADSERAILIPPLFRDERAEGENELLEEVAQELSSLLGFRPERLPTIEYKPWVCDYDWRREHVTVERHGRGQTKVNI